MRVVGFARSRAGAVLRPAGGSATISLRFGARAFGERRVALDAAGAFEASFDLPPSAPAGDYAVLAQVGGGVGGATIHVDASAGSLSLAVAAACGVTCDPRGDVPLTIRSSHGAAVVHVTVVRSPHVYAAYVPETTPWGTTVWLDASVRTGSDGVATISIPHPSDELASTYGVRVESGGASADTRVVVPTSARGDPRSGSTARIKRWERRSDSTSTPTISIPKNRWPARPSPSASCTARRWPSNS